MARRTANDTTLQPQMFVRNTTSQPQTAQVHFNWRSATSSGRTHDLSLPLKPYQTQLLDVAALQARKVLPPEAQWASAFIGIPGVQPDQILAVATSYDKTGRYGSQTPFSDQLSAHWEGDKWQVDDTHNSIITVGNGGAKPAHAKLTLLYNNGKDSYEIDKLLASEEQMWIDVGQLARTQTPDKKGHVLPPGGAFGAYRLEEPGSTGIGNLFEGKLTLDKTYGEAVYGCMTCCNPGFGQMLFNPLGVPVAGYFLQGVWGIDACTGNQVDMTGWFPTWGTDNSAIATANMNNIHGVAAGSTRNYAQGDITWGTGQETHHCPIRADNPSGGTNVQVPTSLSIVAGTDTTSPEASCSAGSFGTGCGVTRSFTYQVNDQYGNPMQVAGLEVWDVITTTSPNNLSIGSYNTTCSPPNTGPCGVTTNSSGQFEENPGLSVCSTVCRVNSACVRAGQTNATQTVHVGSASIVQQLVYYCDHVTVNGN